MGTICTSAPASFSFGYAAGGGGFGGVLKNFNLTLGIGNQSSRLEVQVLWGGCGDRAPRPTLPAIGRAMMFNCNALSFGGIVNSISYKEDAGGFTATISLVDAKQTLDNNTVMYKDYYCPITSVPGFINVMPLLEPGVAICPPGDDTENWPRVGFCGAFGTAGIPGSNSNNGIQTYKVIQALNGYTVYTTCGEALTLDMGFLALQMATIGYYSKLDDSHSTLLALITKACDDIGCDFYVDLVGTRIVIWLINRQIQPNTQVIGDIIRAGASTGTLISGEEGLQEIYGQSNKIVLGDKVNYIAETNASNKPVSMIVGFDAGGNPQRVTKNNFTAVIDITPIVDILGVPLRAGAGQVGAGRAVANWAVTEEEMICSKTVQMWLLYGLQINKNSLSKAVADALKITNKSTIAAVGKAFGTLMNANADIDSWKAAKIELERIGTMVAHKVNWTKYNLAFDWFRSYVNEWYGKKYLIPVNNFCAHPASGDRIIQAEGKHYLSDVPVDSGYPSPNQINNGIRGLDLNSILDTSFISNGDGKIRCFVQLDINTNLIKKINGKNITFKVAPSEMSADSYYIKNNNIYVSANIDGRIFRTNGFPEVLITVNSKLAALPYFPGREFMLNRGLRAFATLFGVGKYDELKDKNKGFADVTSFNIFEIESGAAGVQFAAVPMKSNIYVYGPWISRAGAIGSTRVEVRSDLSPWNYGGYGNLNAVGQGLSNTGLRLSNVDANASFTLAEPPGYNVQYFLQYGIYVDSINLTYDGSSGVTTQYSFKTFTPKFADYSSTIAELVREGARVKNDILTKIRQEQRNRVTAFYAAMKSISDAMSDALKAEIGVQDMASPSFVFIGGYFDSLKQNNSGSGGFGNNRQIKSQAPLSCEELCDFKPPKVPEPGDGGSSVAKHFEIGINTKKEVEDSIDTASLEFIGILSLDGMFSPVSTYGRNNKLPRYANFPEGPRDKLIEDTNRLAKSRPSMPPVFTRLPINQQFLNPILTKALLSAWDDRQNCQEGFNISLISFGTDVADIGNKDKRENQIDLGFAALKGPLVLQSWGYDTEGKPIPNIVDSPSSAERGVFVNEGTKTKFMNDWIRNPKTWPVGPIDLRWDRERGVWVCPPPDRIVVAQLLSDLPGYGAAQAVLLNPQGGEGLFYENYAIYGANGENITLNIKSTTITVSDFLGRKLCKGTRIYAAYNDGKYIVLESSAVNEKECDCVCSTTETTTETTTFSTTETTTFATTEITTETTTQATTFTTTEITTFTTTETGTTFTETETTTQVTTETETEVTTFTETETLTEITTYTTMESPTYTEPPSEETCEDICNLKSCIAEIDPDKKPGVLGIDKNGCLTIYEFTQCETPEY
jgi:hypothetical protein